jgi:hypothetical protein
MINMRRQVQRPEDKHQTNDQYAKTGTTTRRHKRTSETEHKHEKSKVLEVNNFRAYNGFLNLIQ